MTTLIKKQDISLYLRKQYRFYIALSNSSLLLGSPQIKPQTKTEVGDKYGTIVFKYQMIIQVSTVLQKL